MSPDPFVTSAGNWLNFNRYSYVLNNPMMYIDPSGYRYEEVFYENEIKPKGPGNQGNYLYFPRELGDNLGYIGGFGNGADVINPVCLQTKVNFFLSFKFVFGLVRNIL